MQSLATFYRPAEFKDVISQSSIIQVLERQLSTNTFVNNYLFCGPSGCGKTTIARIFAYKLNEYKDENNNLCSSEPIEIDGASNNGVDNIKMLIQNAKERSVDGKYKVFIIDECHMLTIQAWNAFLKCIEEPPKYTVFIFCTTDPQKIPATILNRVMRFNLTKISQDKIKDRLRYICEQEHFTNYEECIDYVSKLANGGMRDAIALLEKCAGYSSDLNIQNVLTCLGNFSYKVMFQLTNSIIDANQQELIRIIESLFNDGNDLKLFIEQYLDFVLDLDKYCVFKNMSMLKIPQSLEEDIKYATGVEDNINYYNWLVNQLLQIKFNLKQDSNIKTTLEIMLLSIAKGIK